MKIHPRILGTLALVGALAATPAFAEIPAYLNIPGVNGDSKDPNYAGWFTVVGFKGGAIDDGPGSSADATAQKHEGNARYPTATATLANSRAVPALASLLGSGAPIETVLFDEVFDGERLRVTYHRVFGGSVENSGADVVVKFKYEECILPKITGKHVMKSF